MSRIRMIMLSLLAVLALSAVAGASASAHSFWVKGHEVKEGEEFKVKGASGTSKLAVPGLASIECKRDLSTGTIKGEGRSTAEVKFTECAVVGFPACTVKEPIEFKIKDQLVIFQGALGDSFEPEVGSVFVTIEIKGAACVIKGKYEVKGTQQCKLPEVEKEKVTHRIVCEPEGSELKFGEKEATFTGEETVELESGEEWSAPHSFWVKGHEVKEGESFTTLDASGTSKLAVPGLATIECERDLSIGTIKGGGRSTDHVKFTECAVVGFPACTVKEPIEFKIKDQLVIFQGALGDSFEPEAGSVFVTIEIKGAACVIKGKYEVKGTQQCKLPEVEKEKVTHKIVCEPEGSELKFGEKDATFTGEETVELESGEEWSAKL